MSTKIILELEDDLTGQETTDLRYLLTDALGEFVSRRTPAINYVESRYEDLAARRADIGEPFNVKVGQVLRRTALAKKLVTAAHDMKIVEVAE